MRIILTKNECYLNKVNGRFPEKYMGTLYINNRPQMTKRIQLVAADGKVSHYINRKTFAFLLHELKEITVVQESMFLNKTNNLIGQKHLLNDLNTTRVYNMEDVYMLNKKVQDGLQKYGHNGLSLNWPYDVLVNHIVEIRKNSYHILSDNIFTIMN